MSTKMFTQTVKKTQYQIIISLRHKSQIINRNFDFYNWSLPKKIKSKCSMKLKKLFTTIVRVNESEIL